MDTEQNNKVDKNDWSGDWSHKYYKKMHSRKYFGAFIVVFIGLVLLLQRLPIDLPKWLFSWDVILIALGLLIGFKSRFRSWTWFAFILLGVGSIASHQFLIDQYKDLIFPIGLIIFGILMFLRLMSNKNNYFDGEYFAHRRMRHMRYKQCRYHNKTMEDGAENTIHIENVFGEVNRNIISKNFEGGYIKNSFGSTNVNLMQCDFENKVTITIENAFGGVKIFVPTHWKVVSKLDANLSGIDDKTFYDGRDNDKIKYLVLRGRSVFGGIEIKNFN